MIATGNGAAYYVAQALWLASLDGSPAARVVAVPAASWPAAASLATGDRLLAISSSGEFRDVIDAVEQGAPRPVAAAATPGSSLGKLADGARRADGAPPARATHTQAFCGGVATALAVWARVTGDDGLARRLAGAPAAVERAIAATERFMEQDAACTRSARGGRVRLRARPGRRRSRARCS